MQVSFSLSVAAFRSIARDTRGLLPGSGAVIESAYRRGELAGAYYFVDVAALLARDMRDWFRESAALPGSDAPICARAAARIDERLDSRWHDTRVMPD